MVSLLFSSDSPVSLEQVGERFGFDGTGSYCHSGMLASAQWLCDDLEKQGILPKLLIGNNCSHPEFKLYLAGHSLGAGVAAILSLLLQSRYPDHKCLCYEPPGCVLSPSIANQENMISFVLGTDIVPRLSMEAMEHLRDDVLDMILRTKVPKHRVFAQTRFFPRDLSSVPSNVLLIHSKESIPACTFRDKLEEFKSYGEAKKAERGENSALVTPGRIIHLVKTGEEEAVRFSLRPASPTDHYTPVWANRDDFGEIQLSTTLIADHNPETVAVELQRIADSFSSQLELSQSNSRVNH